MAVTVTAQRVLDMAPDASSAKAGQGLARAAKWKTLGRSDRAAWGEIQGSGKTPYQTRVDLNEFVSKCSCPSRKFPCKHALGLLLVLAETPDAFTQTEPPAEDLSVTSPPCTCRLFLCDASGERHFGEATPRVVGWAEGKFAVVRAADRV